MIYEIREYPTGQQQCLCYVIFGNGRYPCPHPRPRPRPRSCPSPRPAAAAAPCSGKPSCGGGVSKMHESRGRAKPSPEPRREFPLHRGRMRNVGALGACVYQGTHRLSSGACQGGLGSSSVPLHFVELPLSNGSGPLSVRPQGRREATPSATIPRRGQRDAAQHSPKQEPSASKAIARTSGEPPDSRQQPGSSNPPHQGEDCHQ